MEAATRLYPVVLLLEDLQWADPVSVDVLCHLGRRAARQRILILGTCRSFRGRGGRTCRCTAACSTCARPGHGHELALGPARRARRRAVARAALPRQRLRCRRSPRCSTRAPRACRSSCAACSSCSPARRDIEPRPGRLPARAAARGARPRAVEGRQGPGARTPRDAARSRARAARGRERPRQGVLERHRARRSRAETSSSSRSECSGSAACTGCSRAAARRSCPTGRSGPATASRTASTSACSTRTSSPRAAASSTGGPGSCWCATGARTRRSRAVEMAEHFERGRDLARAVRFRTLAGEHAVRRFAGVEAVDHYTAGLELLHRQPRPSCGRWRRRSTAARAQARLLLARFDEAARDYQAMLERAREARSLRPAARRSAGSATRTSSSSGRPRCRARAREALAGGRAATARRTTSRRRAAASRRSLVMEGRLEEARRALDAVSRVRPGPAASQAALAARPASTAASCTTGTASSRACESAHGRGARGVRGARRRLRGLRPSGCSRALARVNLGRVSEALATSSRRRSFAEPATATVLAAAAGQPPGLDPPRARRPGRAAREFDARALALAREKPLALDARGRRAAEPLRRRRPRRESGGRLRPARDSRGRHAHARLVPLDERAAPSRESQPSTTPPAATTGRRPRGPLGSRASRSGSGRSQLPSARPPGSTAEVTLAEEASAASRSQSSSAPSARSGTTRRRSRPGSLGASLGLFQQRLGDERAALAAFVACGRRHRHNPARYRSAGAARELPRSPPVREVLEQAGRA